MKLRNKSNYKFIDISNEIVREYHFMDRILRIDKPSKLYISESGGHRIFAKTGRCIYVPNGYLWIEWKTYNGKPHFRF